MTPGTGFERLKQAAPALSVGVVSADLTRLGEEVQMLEDSGAAAAHFDVMDGVFCPAMTAGPPLLKAVRTSLLKDAHLMIADPIDKLESYVAAGADVVTFHVEATTHPHRALQRLGELENRNDPARGIVRGVALNPGTPVAALEPLCEVLDLVVLLAVNPGFPGQRYAAATARRAEQVRELAARAGREVLLCVDGGVTRDTITEIARLRPDLVVTGSAVFDGRDPPGNVRFLLERLRA